MKPQKMRRTLAAFYLIKFSTEHVQHIKYTSKKNWWHFKFDFIFFWNFCLRQSPFCKMNLAKFQIKKLTGVEKTSKEWKGNEKEI